MIGKVIATTLVVSIIAAGSATAYAATTTATKTADNANRGYMFKSHDGGDPFAKLLEDKIISDETHTKMTAYLKANMPEKPATGATTMAKPEDGKNPMLEELLTANVITQAEYDALNTAMQAARPEKPDGERGERPEKPDGERPAFPDAPDGEKPAQQDHFAKFVTDGVISQATADAIAKHLEANQPDGEKFKGKHEKVDMFSEMLTAGIITQAEYDAIKAAMPQMKTKIRGRAATASETETETETN